MVPGTGLELPLELPLIWPILPGSAQAGATHWRARWPRRGEDTQGRSAVGSAPTQGLIWGAAAHDWAVLQEPAARPLWQMLLEAAEVGLGTRFLDAGCGSGGASVLAAQRGARVNGLDAAATLVGIARTRVPDGDFRVGEIEALPYAAGTFDVVLACDVLPYAADPLAALRELRRVCAPGGRVALSVWATPEECAQAAIVAALNAVLPAPLHVAWFALTGPGELESLVAAAGLVVVEAGRVACVNDYADAASAVQAVAAAGPVQAALRVIGVAHLQPAILQALMRYRKRDGVVRLINAFQYITAASPGAGPATAATSRRRRRPGVRQRQGAADRHGS